MDSSFNLQALQDQASARLALLLATARLFLSSLDTNMISSQGTAISAPKNEHKKSKHTTARVVKWNKILPKRPWRK
jgi:hypothetical protein